MNTAATANLTTFKASTATKTTDVLVASMLLLEKAGVRLEAEHLTFNVIADTLMARLDLEAEFDRIYFDEDFDGTFAEAMLMAMDAKGVPA